MEIQSTRAIKSSPIILAYGPAGSGKTVAIKTAPKPFVISTDRGLRSLSDFEIPFCEIKTEKEFKEAIDWVEKNQTGPQGSQQFETICIDDLSEIAEIILREELPTKKDGRQAYYEMQTKVLGWIRRIRDIKTNHNLYITAKLDKSRDAVGNTIYGPMLPGQTLTSILPHQFDELYYVQVYTDPTTNQIARCFRTFQDGQYYAKSRCSKVGPYEQIDLASIFAKIRS